MLIAFIWWAMACRGDDLNRPKACSFFPDELQGICLGMSVEEVRAKRATKLRQDNDLPPAQYVELGLNSIFFDRVVYEFSAAGLVKVVLYKTVKEHKFIDEHRKEFLKFALQKWGHNPELFVRTQKGMRGELRHFPVLVWRRPEAVVAISYTPSLDLQDNSSIATDPLAPLFFYYFEVTIVDPSLPGGESALKLTPARELPGSEHVLADYQALGR